MIIGTISAPQYDHGAYGYLVWVRNSGDVAARRVRARLTLEGSPAGPWTPAVALAAGEEQPLQAVVDHEYLTTLAHTGSTPSYPAAPVTPAGDIIAIESGGLAVEVRLGRWRTLRKVISAS